MKTTPTLMLSAAVLLLAACTTSESQGDAGKPASTAPSETTSAPAAPAPATPVPAANHDPTHNANNSLDWAGAYRGILPCADCEGIQTTVVLAADGSYSRKTRYLGGSNEETTEQGHITWDAKGSSISFSGSSQVRYFVAENRLIQLAQDGSRIVGENANKYALDKQDFATGITEKYWKLVELNGQPVAASANEPHLIFKAEGGSVNGSGGCNRLTGSIELNESTQRIRFDHVASTMMACTSGMDVEQVFLEVLRSVDNYSLDGDHLSLNKARMAPLARLEAVYLR